MTRHIMSRTSWQSFSSDEGGSNLIEFALTIPLLLIVILGIVDFAFVLQRYEVIANATREGARMASLPGYGQIDIQNRVEAYLQAGGIPTSPGNPTVVVGAATVPAQVGTWPATTVDVTYTHDYMFIGGIASWFGGSFTDVTLGSAATMRNELDTAPGP